MQIFGEVGRDKERKTNVGEHGLKIVKASSKNEGTHSVRFYPLSTSFHEGADYISIVQSVHWLNKKFIVCHQTSYDYSVPDTEEKPFVGSSCVICNDKFAWYKKAKAIKESDPQESERLRKVASSLRETTAAASIVSFTDANGNLTPPVILRYGKELLEQVEMHAYRVKQGADGKGNGPHLCDPVKGYMFDIIIGKNPGGYRTYKNSMPSVSTEPVDITSAPWKWDEICCAIRSEIMDIPTPEEVHNFYLANYGTSKSSSQFVHPAFQDNTKSNEGSQAAASTSQSNIAFSPPKTKQPDENKVRSSTPTFAAPTPSSSASLNPCHSQADGGSGYEQGDAQCSSCDQAKECRENSTPIKAESAVPDKSVSSNFDASDVKSKLDALNAKMQSNA